MGKPFKRELEKISDTIRWAEEQDVLRLSRFLFVENKQTPLVCIGSGGSLSACHFATLLYKIRNGVLAEAMTPLQLMYSGREIIRNNKLLFMSASGKNKDLLNVIKYGVKYNETGMMSLTLHKYNPMEELLEQYQKVQRWCEDIPGEKDGFLATNSLVATFTLLSHSYGIASISEVVSLDGNYSKNRDFDLADIQNFVVLFGAAGEPVAWDIESKLTEAALGSALLSDYRNFGHGRHHWLAKRKENSCVIALVTPVEKKLAEKTLDCLPKDVPIIIIESNLELPKASIDLLIKSFHFVYDLGEARGIDPGRPGVPSYGRLLYNLDYFKLTNSILPVEKTLDLAVQRKLGVTGMENAKLREHYREACQRFVKQLNKGRYTAVAFDYDGTLSAPDPTSIYTKYLRDDIKNSLLQILENGAEIRVSTRRGKSVGELFKNSFNKKFWPQVKVGYYNGVSLLVLGEEEDLEKWEKLPFDTELKVLREEIRRRLPKDCIKYEYSERNLLFIIEKVTTESDAEILYNTCCEIIWDMQLKGIHVWRISHSMDIVVYHEISIQHVFDDAGHTLCVGDYGSLDGNSYELMTNKASLSVDKVSKNAECCWNIAPSGKKGLDATLYYLSRLTVKDGVIKCRFSI